MIATTPISSFTASKIVNGTTTVVLTNGTTVTVQTVALDHAPILNYVGLAPGSILDTTKAIDGIESTYGTKQVPLRTSDQFNNSQSSQPGPVNPGEYAIDYTNGILYIIPLTSGSASLTYKIRALVTTTA